MSEEKPLIRMKPGMLSTPERVRARFHSHFLANEILALRTGINVTPELLKEYMDTQGEDGDRLRRIRGQANTSTIGMGLGLFGGGLQILRWTKVPPLVVTGTILTTFVGSLVGDDIGSWVYGTYKFDRGETTKRMIMWIREKQGLKPDLSEQA